MFTPHHTSSESSLLSPIYEITAMLLPFTYSQLSQTIPYDALFDLEPSATLTPTSTLDPSCLPDHYTRFMCSRGLFTYASASKQHALATANFLLTYQDYLECLMQHLNYSSDFLETIHCLINLFITLINSTPPENPAFFHLLVTSNNFFKSLINILCLEHQEAKLLQSSVIELLSRIAKANIYYASQICDQLNSTLAEKLIEIAHLSESDPYPSLTVKFLSVFAEFYHYQKFKESITPFIEIEAQLKHLTDRLSSPQEIIQYSATLALLLLLLLNQSVAIKLDTSVLNTLLYNLHHSNSTAVKNITAYTLFALMMNQETSTKLYQLVVPNIITDNDFLLLSTELKTLYKPHLTLKTITSKDMAKISADIYDKLGLIFAKASVGVLAPLHHPHPHALAITPAATAYWPSAASSMGTAAVGTPSNTYV